MPVTTSVFPTNRWPAFILGVLLAVAPVLAPAQLPTLGDGSDMTFSAERRLGDRIAREIYRDPDYIDDPVLAEYVQGIWQPLLAAARARGDLSPEMDGRFAWEVMLGRDRTVNAFALPGGYLGLHLGLIAVVSSRDELASVMAHELSHVTQRHIARSMGKQNAQSPWMIAAMILGVMAASKNPEAANALIVGGQAVAIQSQLNFSRDMEREADRIGYATMSQAGFEPQGFVTMFDKLQQAARLNDNGSFPYLRSHPMTTERMADMQARQQLDARPATPGGQTMEHAMLVARARVFSAPGNDVLHSWLAQADSATLDRLPLPQQAAALYAAALVSVKQRAFDKIPGLLSRLGNLTHSDARAARLTRLLAAESGLAAGEARRAVALAEAGTGSGTLARPELLLAAQGLVRLGRSGEAAQRLQTWVSAQPRDAAAWQLLESAYAAQGQTLRAIRAGAEMRVAQLDYAAALDRFKAAQEWLRQAGPRSEAGEHIEASIIDARTRQVESLLKEQALER